MNHDLYNQAINQLKSASNILVIPGADPSFDYFGAALAIKNYFSGTGKQIRVLAAKDIPQRVDQMFGSSEVENTGLNKNTVIEVSLDKTELSELSYQKLPDFLRIFLTPKPGGEFRTDDIKIITAAYPYDLIVTTGVIDLSELGKLFAEHAQLFYETPVLNIDFRAGNENFGQINLIDLTASSVSEVTFDLLDRIDRTAIDEKTATLLLTGIVSATNSFQVQKTTPQVFQKASILVELGARQQEVISKLYRSKSLGLLHLWGRVLARLKQDALLDLVYSAVTASDIERSGATQADLEEIVPEMNLQLSFAKHLVFLFEESNTTKVYVFLSKPLDAESLFASFGPQSRGGQVYSFSLNKPLSDAEAQVVEIIKSELAKTAR